MKKFNPSMLKIYADNRFFNVKPAFQTGPSTACLAHYHTTISPETSL